MKKRIYFNSPVVLTFAITSLLALLIIKLTDGQAKYHVFGVYRSSPNLLFFARLIGHVFGHANFQHYIGNIMMILLLGPVLEERYGSLDLAVIMGITAIITGLVHILLSSNTILLGASGIVFMMIIMTSYTNIKSNKIPLTFVLVFVLYIGREVIDGVIVNDQISHLAHITGGLAGSFFGYILNRHHFKQV
ncbi:rhomboid family intramembrane serine protease [Clostridiaceae bacterium M8S5]|nr:rhomboid family intramembrane serine protease [Clostridiaceae bacterium M8S5]